MLAIKNITREHEDADLMMRELLSGIDPDSCVIGFLSCMAVSNHSDLVARLQKAVPFPVVGGTTLCSPFAEATADIAATLVVLSGDDFCCRAELSPVLNPETAAKSLKQLFDDCTRQLDGAPKLFLVIMPIFSLASAAFYLEEVFALAGSVPVFGGMVSDEMTCEDFAVFANGSGFKDRMVLVAIGGQIRPTLAFGRKLTFLSDYEPTVTKADGTAVYRVDDLSFCEYLAKLGFDDGKGVVIGYPLSVLMKGGQAAADGTPETGLLLSVDNRKGCGIFSRPVPEGVRISVGLLTHEDVADSVHRCMRTVARMMAVERGKGYRYSMAFCVSCLGRYYSMVGRENGESEVLRRELAAMLPVFGYYGFNEVCPTRDATGTYHNRAHVDSIVVCAF